MLLSISVIHYVLCCYVSLSSMTPCVVKSLCHQICIVLLCLPVIHYALLCYVSLSFIMSCVAKCLLPSNMSCVTMSLCHPLLRLVLLSRSIIHYDMYCVMLSLCHPLCLALISLGRSTNILLPESVVVLVLTLVHAVPLPVQSLLLLLPVLEIKKLKLSQGADCKFGLKSHREDSLSRDLM